MFAELRRENNQLRDALEAQRAENRALSRLLEAARRPAEVQAPAPEAFELPDPYTRRVEMDDD